MGKNIPKDTLHRRIHSKIHDIPTPNGKECKLAYKFIKEGLKSGILSYNDTLEKRISILIFLWKEKCPATCAMLEWQSELISKFYQYKKPP